MVQPPYSQVHPADALGNHPWLALDRLKLVTASEGLCLVARLPTHPAYCAGPLAAPETVRRWHDPAVATSVRLPCYTVYSSCSAAADAHGLLPKFYCARAL